MLIVKVMPVFDQVFQELGVEMSGAAAGVLHLGNGLRRYALVFLILFLLLAVGLLYLTRTTKDAYSFGRSPGNFRFPAA